MLPQHWALLAEAKGVIEGLDAIISREVSKEWADFFGKDYEDMSACLSRITAALAEKDKGVKIWIGYAQEMPNGKLHFIEHVGLRSEIHDTGRPTYHVYRDEKPLPPLPKGDE